MDAFEIKGLTFSYPEQARPAIEEISLSLPEGSLSVLAGPSGCGKSTLLRLLKPALSPHGRRAGEILFMGAPLEKLDERRQSSEIGFVQQSPDGQIVTDKVWHELAFGLESLGMDTPSIRARVAEMASFFGIQGWFHRDVSQLSGGQKQLLNLASVMAMQPRVLILDEPTSQLDPIAASDFLATIVKINRELGTTVLLTEHRLEEILPCADTLFVLDAGRIVSSGTPQAVGQQLRSQNNPMFFAMPAPMRIYAAVQDAQDCPVTVRDGRLWLARYAENHSLLPLPQTAPPAGGETVVTAEDVWFRYEKDAPDVVRDFQLSVKKGTFYAILGGNGAGKTTALSLLAGVRRPYRGKIVISGKTALLPQDPQTLFVHNTVAQELDEMLEGAQMSGQARQDALSAAVRLCQLDHLLERHPYDLSGGEQQRAALAKVLLTQPDILLLDEPTKGLDAGYKRQLAALLRALLQRGVTVVMVSHDVEFCAEYADECGLFFDGGIVSAGPPRAFFSGNSFYTTAANRMARQLLPEAVTCADVIEACGGTVPHAPEPPQTGGAETFRAAPAARTEAAGGRKKLPAWRAAAACVSAAAALLAFLHTVSVIELPALFGTGSGGYAALLASLIVLVASVCRRGQRPTAQLRREKLPKRTVCAAAVILLCIPLTILAGVFLLDDRKYMFISLFVLLETMLPFALVFEGRRPKTRELVTIAVLCALGVAGRAAFFMLPQFKPVAAIVIIAGVALGGEAGFLVGAVTMLVSDMFFGQGPWTPWQMFAMGLIGFLSGVLFKKGLLGRDRATLAVFGALSALLIYGGIVNPASALMWQAELNWQTVLAYYISGFPMDTILAAATAAFLWVFGESMLEKLDRIKVKYGLVEPEHGR